MKAAKSAYLVPTAIILAGLVLSVAIYVIRAPQGSGISAGDIAYLAPVTAEDHARGGEDALVTVIMYTDLDCAYCKQAYEAMEQILADHEETGDLRFVLRHFPILDTNPYSGLHAEAAECAAALGGADRFWGFITRIHAEAPGTKRFNPQGYGSVASSLGISPDEFLSCIEGTRFDSRVDRDFTNALAIGAAAAPYTVLTANGMQPVTIEGFVPYQSLSELIDAFAKKAR